MLYRLMLFILITSFGLTTQAQHNHHDRQGHHGMVLLTDGQQLYASHLPLYQSPHDYQLIYRVRSQHQQTLIETLDSTQMTLLPERFDLNRLITGKTFSINTTLYKGHFERGGEAFLTDTHFTFEQLIFKRRLSNMDQTPSGTQFFVLDTAVDGQQWVIHAIGKRPSFDMIALLNNQDCQPQKINTHLVLQFADELGPINAEKALSQCGKLNILYSETQDFRALEASNKDQQPTSLMQKQWIHGAGDCSDNQEPAIDLFSHDENSHILRQNKCLHYEAPFIYVLFGDEKVLVVDTGATEEAEKFPLFDTIQQLISQKYPANQPPHVIVVHSHSHSDHIAADGQFSGQPNTTVVEANGQAVQSFFGFKNWPNHAAKLDLGQRPLTILPIPGHQADSIAIFDAQTGWLLTGDTFYPGRLYIKNWQVFKNSIAKLTTFSEQHQPTAILGTHIEMTSTPFKDYPISSQYQPQEASLILTLDDLNTLNETLKHMGDQPQKQALEKFVIYPLD